MVNDLRELLRDNVASPPHQDDDLSAVLRGGRRRVRRRRIAVLGGTAVATAVVVGLASVVWPSPPDLDAAGVPLPDAPTLRLTDAQEAVLGDDYRVLASYTNDDLEKDNGQYFDGVTEDGMILFRDGPRRELTKPRFALLEPGDEEKTWLPDPPLPNGEQLWPVHLGAERLVLTGVAQSSGDGASGSLFALVYDREVGSWQRQEWPELPELGLDAGLVTGTVGPDGRLYVGLPASQGKPPAGGWPTGPHGEADDADADGDTYELWSVALTDGSDVRDEGLTVGDVEFTDTSMVWTDSTNGDSGMVHVRNLKTGEEHSFDPRSGDKCNLLSFGATDEHIVMGQYCGTYDGGVRDDRVQVLTDDGDQVVTLQDDSIEGTLSQGSDVVTVVSHQRGLSGTYLYDLGSDRFLRLSDEVSSWATGGPAPDDRFMWNTPVNRGDGATQRLGELLD
jgi:hypothetical protein